MSNKKATTSNFVWVFFGTAGQNLLQFSALIVLARLISPEDFGIVSAAMIFIGLIGIFSELGVGPAIVQKLELTTEDVGTGKVISAALGLLMGMGVYASARFFESFMRIDGLAGVVQLLAFVLPISGLTVIGQSLLQRHLEFKKYILCIFISYLISQLFVAIPLAFMGYGYHSLVVATLVQNLVLLLSVSFLTRSYGGWTFSLTSAKTLANYGFGQSLGKFANYLAGQGDNFVVGRFLGASSLGIYGRSYQLLMVPTNLIGAVLDKVMFPMMAAIQKDNKELANIYILSMSIIAMVSVPTTAFVYVFSEEIIRLLLGDNWLDAAPVLKILITVLFFRISYKVSDALSRAKGSVYRRAWRQTIFAGSVIISSYYGSFYGLEGVAYGVTVSIIFNYILMLQLSKTLISFSYADIAVVIIKNVFTLIVCILLLDRLKDSIGQVAFLQLIVLGVFTLLISIFIWALLYKLYEREKHFIIRLIRVTG